MSGVRFTHLFLVALFGCTTAAARNLSAFSRTWIVRPSSTSSGPGPNEWTDSSSAIFVNRTTHALHLRLVKNVSTDKVGCVEVTLPDSLGHGIYEFDVQSILDDDLSQLGGKNPHVVLGMFLYKNDTQELDVELSRWGNASSSANNGDFVNQPPTKLTASYWKLPPRPKKSITTFQIDYSRAAVTYSAFDRNNRSRVFSTFTSQDRIPQPEGMLVHLNLWMFQGSNDLNADVEVALTSFKFAPHVPPAAIMFRGAKIW